MNSKRRLAVCCAAIACVFAAAQTTFASSLSTLIDEAKLVAFSPRSSPLLRKTLVESIPLLEAAEINSELRLKHFLVQLATETGGFQRLDENMNYSAARLLEVFKGRVTPQQAEALAFKPIEIANHVYANMIGNGGPETGDGWRFRGSGFIQLTGRGNYRSIGLLLKLPLEQEPERVRVPQTGIEAAIAYWSIRKINDAADADDVRRVRALVNGGYHGLDQTLVWEVRARRAFVPGSPRFDFSEEDREEQFRAASEILRGLGYLPPTGAPANLVPLDEVLKEFQKDFGLTQTGEIDEATFYRLVDPFGRFDR